LTDSLHIHRDQFSSFIDELAHIELVFDHRGEEAQIVAAWAAIRDQLPDDISRLYGPTPAFRDDAKVLPLQAADFWAWWVRHASLSAPDPLRVKRSFPWDHDRSKPKNIFIVADGEMIQSHILRHCAHKLGGEFHVFPNIDV
jgi:hypothetical protein